MPRQRTAGHGTPSMYRFGCRCAECVGRKASDTAAYVARRKQELAGGSVVPSVSSNTSTNTPTNTSTGEVAMTGREMMVASAKMLNAEIVAKAMAPRPVSAPPAPTRYQGPQRPPNRVDEEGVVRVPSGWE